MTTVAIPRITPWPTLAALAHVAVSCLPARQYITKLMNVTRIMTFTTVILADITPRTPSIGWCVPPIFRASSRLATREWGVIQTPRQMSKITSIVRIGFRYLASEPGMRYMMPSQK